MPLHQHGGLVLLQRHSRVPKSSLQNDQGEIPAEWVSFGHEHGGGTRHSGGQLGVLDMLRHSGPKDTVSTQTWTHSPSPRQTGRDVRMSDPASPWSSPSGGNDLRSHPDLAFPLNPGDVSEVGGIGPMLQVGRLRQNEMQ